MLTVLCRADQPELFAMLQRLYGVWLRMALQIFRRITQEPGKTLLPMI
jgi:hypothetical protein